MWFLATTAASAIKVGDRLPDGLALHAGFPPETISLNDRVAGRKVLLIGLPGACTLDGLVVLVVVVG